jgi:hypothetical protein
MQSMIGVSDECLTKDEKKTMFQWMKLRVTNDHSTAQAFITTTSSLAPKEDDKESITRIQSINQQRLSTGSHAR